MSREGRDYEKDWEEFWKEICTNSNGSLNFDQIKRELSDCRMWMDHLSKIICHVTGDRVSKINTLPEVVCQIADEMSGEYVEECLEELAELLGYKKDPATGDYIEI